MLKILNKGKELTPSLYNINEMGKDLLSDYKIISEEELKCEGEKRLKVKQRKSSLSYHGFVYGETQFEEPPKVPLKRRDQAMLKFEKQTFSKLKLNREELFNSFFEHSYEQNVNNRDQNRLAEEFEPLVKDVNFQLNCFEKSLVKEIKDDLKYATSLKDEFDEKCLILDIQKEFFKTQFESAISESYSHVYENKIFKQNSSLENESCCLKKTITQLQKDFLKLEAQSIDFEIALQYKIQENNSLKTMQTENENFVASLQIKNAHLKQTYKYLLELVQSSRVETNQCDKVNVKFDFDEIET
ncbi:hypothetical protein Tco_0850716 [Tanacetum coccineum]